MSNKKISQLPESLSLVNTDLLPIVNFGTTKKITGQTLANFTNEILNSLSGNWQATYSVVSALSSFWNSVYTTVDLASASWSSVYASVANVSALWNSVHTSVNNVSGNWDSVYSSVKNVSGNWDSVYSSVKNVSGNWDSVYSSVKNVSGNWDSVYSTVKAISGTQYLHLTGGTLTGGLTGTDAVFSSVSGTKVRGDGSLLTGLTLDQFGNISGGSTINQFVGDGVNQSFYPIYGYNGVDKGAYLVSVGGIDQPGSFWEISSANNGQITFTEAPKNGEVISVRVLKGVVVGTTNLPAVFSTVSAADFFGDGTNLRGVATKSYVDGKFFALSGGTINGVTRVNGDLTIFGNLTSTGTQTFANTNFSTTSALSVVNFGSGAALYVGQNGSGDIASFYDLDQNVEVLHIGGANGSFPNVGIKMSNPEKDFTVNGEISARGIIWDGAGNSNNWNSVYTTVNSTSSTQYLTLSGGTLTGGVTGTEAVFSSVSATALYGDGSNLTGLTIGSYLSAGGGTLTGGVTGTEAVFASISGTKLYGDGSALTGLTVGSYLSAGGGTLAGGLTGTNAVFVSVSGTKVYGDGSSLTNINADKIRSVDVSTTTPINGQALVYNSSTQRYEPATPSSVVAFARTRYIGNGVQRAFFPIQGYVNDDETNYLVTVSSLLADSDQTNGDFTITSANGGTITFNGAVPNNDAKIVCRVLGSSGNLEVAKKAATTIVSQPQNLTKESGLAASFSVTATGEGSVSYQWYVNGQIANGQTSSSISGTAGNGLFVDGNTFYVVVNSTGGTVTSNTVNLTVTAPLQGPAIQTQPQSKSVGSENSFNLSVTSSGATSYQWYKGDAASSNFQLIEGATSATYTTNAPYVDLAAQPVVETYKCIVSDGIGQTESNIATVTTYEKGVTILGISPSNPTVNDGESAVTLTVDAVGAISQAYPLVYLWEISTDAGSTWTSAGSTTKTITLPNTLSNNGNQYRCLVSNEFSSTNGNVYVTLTVNPVAPTIGAIENIYILQGTNLQVSPSVTGSLPRTYSWQWEGGIDGWNPFATGSTLNDTLGNYGITENITSYRLVVTNDAGTATRTFAVSSLPGGTRTFTTVGTHSLIIPAGVTSITVQASAGNGSDGTATDGTDGSVGADATTYYNQETLQDELLTTATTGANGNNGNASPGAVGKSVSIPQLGINLAGGTAGSPGIPGYGGGGSGGAGIAFGSGIWQAGADGSAGNGPSPGGGGLANGTGGGAGGPSGPNYATSGESTSTTTGGAGGTGAVYGGNGGAGGNGGLAGAVTVFGGGGGGGGYGQSGGGGGGGSYTAGTPGKGGTADTSMCAGGVGETYNNTFVNISVPTTLSFTISEGEGNASISITY